MEKESTQLLDPESGSTIPLSPSTLMQRLSAFVPKIFLQALTLTFLAEWGDRSQLATIILAAREVCSSFLHLIFKQLLFIDLCLLM